MSNVLVNNLIVRSAPSTTSEEIAKCNTGQIINSGEELIQNEEGIWLRYTGQSGKFLGQDHQQFILLLHQQVFLEFQNYLNFLIID